MCLFLAFCFTLALLLVVGVHLGNGGILKAIESVPTLVLGIEYWTDRQSDSSLRLRSN